MVSCSKSQAGGTISQCLRDLNSNGDWYSQIEVQVIHGVAVVDFRRENDGTDACRAITLTAIHHGKEVARRLVNLAVSD
jgi:hypothetical protein